MTPRRPLHQQGLMEGRRAGVAIYVWPVPPAPREEKADLPAPQGTRQGGTD